MDAKPKKLSNTLQGAARPLQQLNTRNGLMQWERSFIKGLPQDIYQTAKVAKILLLMEKGKGNRYRGKKLSEINIDDNEYYSSEYEGDEELIMQKVLKRVTRGKKPEDELDTGDSDRYVHQSTERDQHNENTLSRNYFKKATSPFHESNEENSEEPPTKKN
ncbi:uncharacterized protein LOC126893414 [Diabrotica virgifera virgifera]|uniref:Uncharacterized protein n=1 Tax=Diabrotica virgifera virgifera TaxID=50390 RepID=A0ABM5LAQ9_DIAVI|nr:uncharacterized protein LOC126893414 [Diabrotica virgifera virgifera]